MRRAPYLVLTLSAFAPVFASCADSGSDDGAGASELDGGTDRPQTNGELSHDASSDAGDPAAAPTECDEADFCFVEKAVPTGTTLTSTWGSSANDVWAVGNLGAVFHFNGTQWAPVSSGTGQTLFGIGGSGPDDVWIASSRALILHTNGFKNGAATFTKVGPAAPVYFYEYPDGVWEESLTLSIWGAGRGDVFVGGEPYPVEQGQGLPVRWESQWRSSNADGGVAWTATTPKQGVSIYAIWGSSPDDVWAVGGDRGFGNPFFEGTGQALHRSSDGTWQEVDTQSVSLLRAVWGSGPNDVWAVGESGTIRRWRGQGRFEIVASPTIKNLRAIWGSGPNDVWAAGEQGTLIHFDGTQWVTARAFFPPTLVPDLSGIWGSGAKDVWVVGDGVVLHSHEKKTPSVP